MIIPAGMSCRRCPHPATETYADSVTDWTHGHVEYLCEHCLLEKQIALAGDLAAKLPLWREQLKVACRQKAGS